MKGRIIEQTVNPALPGPVAELPMDVPQIKEGRDFRG